ncbi:LADA_0A08328g1_1 [Lachancea dasiensis]|uniref:LADA_0A08328g1_1 n=1 Tax=Lachancea dasiensis TaxID=1072105 RepID=A0A1G4IQ93_9SACH|nr:LADA_0A08328g1_1 [Lachancea dasiensis]
MTKVVLEGGKEILIRDIQDDFSFLELIDRVDTFPLDYSHNIHFQQNVYSVKAHHGEDVGFVLKSVVQKMLQLADVEFNAVFDIQRGDRQSICFKSHTFETRNDNLNALATKLRAQNAFECLLGWRNEFYSVYCNRKPYVLVERAFSGLLGIITYGVHVNGYTRDPVSGIVKIWVPRRSATKATWPSMLDNIVAGGLGYPHGVYETVVKESLEEANLPQEFIESRIRPVGAVSYFYFQGNIEEDKFQTEESLITGEVEYLYDLELPPEVIPHPNDDEVESFKLMTLQETIDALKSFEFKPNCALVMLEFLIRHGYIHSENEPNLLEIMNRIHRSLPFPVRS